jgi:hypothetical protein
LRRLCGWQHPKQIPSESTFSRAFAEFTESELPSRVHEALIKRTHKERLVGHISRDATAIEAREKPVKVEATEKPARKRGRPKKGRLERQADMSLPEMLSDLPKHCAVGTKRNAKGHTTSWKQAASRCRRWRYSHQRPLDLRLIARQPSGDPVGDHDGGPRHQSLRPDGLRL